jgi:hypothetical protein
VTLHHKTKEENKMTREEVRAAKATALTVAMWDDEY